MAVHRPQACVIGDTDLVRPLGRAGVRCAVVAPRGAAVHHSRYTATSIEWADPWSQPDVLVQRLVDYGLRQEHPPVLYYQDDAALLFVSRNRELLGKAFRFVIADSEHVEQLVDKAAFQALSVRLGLPVPAATPMQPRPGTPPPLDLRFPLIIKPLTRADVYWGDSISDQKAFRVDSYQQLAKCWPRLAAAERVVLAQELVPGPETTILSYHVYVDDGGEVVGDFTGRKIRTRPREYGFTTALAVTRAEDVLEAGRSLVRAIGLRGVAKFDFKRAPDGDLKLLEVNPRFNLWHHPGAVAGVDLPALVYADLTGTARPPARIVRDVHWCSPRDLQSARAWGVPLWRWLQWAARCETTSVFAREDPLPLLWRCAWPVAQKVRSVLQPQR